MICTDFKDNYQMYENMAIWEIKSMDELFRSHEMLFEIFEKEYGFPYADRNHPDNRFQDDILEVCTKLLAYFGDKFFFIFTYANANFQILTELQDRGFINFGLDLRKLNRDNVYVLEMDKTKDLKMYDTL